MQWNALGALTQQHTIIPINVGIPVGVTNVRSPVVPNVQQEQKRTSCRRGCVGPLWERLWDVFLVVPPFRLGSWKVMVNLRREC